MTFSTTVGSSSASSGTMNVSGAGTTFSTGSSLTVGSSGGGRLNVTGGAAVGSGSSLRIGSATSGIGVVQVDGVGSALTSGVSTTTVGSIGNGTLHILNGGFVNSKLSATIGSNSSSTGVVNVEGGNATWQIASNLTIGFLGSGTLNVRDGGIVNVGGPTTSTNSLSTLRVDGGTLNARSLNVSAGTFDFKHGTVNLTNGTLTLPSGSFTLNGSGGTATLNLTSVNSTIAGTWTVGSTGSASMTVTGPSSGIASDGLVIGSGSNSNGSMTLSGTGANWTNSSSTTVANNGTGSLTISNGATLANSSTSLNNIIGIFSGSAGSVTVSGTGATWTMNAPLFVGAQGTGTLLISGGGSVSNTSATLGSSASGKGTATVTGTNSAWTNSGNLTVGGSGSGSLLVSDNGAVNVGATLAIGSQGAVELNGGTIATSSISNSGGKFEFKAGTLQLNGGSVTGLSRLTIPASGTLSGSGTISAEVLGSASSTITLSNNLTIGNSASFLGFHHDGILSVGAHTTTLNSASFANLGVLTTIAGGTINAPNGVTLGIGDNLVGHGVVSGKVAAGMGSTIVASGGDLSLGDASSPVGFASDGELRIGSNHVTLSDSNQAVLGALTSLGASGVAGQLSAANGAIVDFGRNLIGFGTVTTPNLATKPLINNGDISGNSIAEPITLPGYVKGVGTFNNVVFTGTFAPGLSPAALSMGNATYAGTLKMEIGGLSPGSQHDQLNHSGAANLGGTLDLELINSFTPAPTDTFTILTHASRSGTFSSITGFTISSSQSFAVNYTDTATTAIAGQWNNAQLTGIIDVPGAELLVTGDVNWTGTLAKRGTGNMELDASSSSMTGSPVLDIEAGSVLLKTDVGATNPNLTINVNLGAATFDSTQQLTALNVADGTSVVMTPDGDRVLLVRSLNLDTTAALDLNDNDLIVDYTGASPYTALLQHVLDGYRSAPDPSATGIVSSTSQHQGGDTILALVDNAAIGGFFTNWLGHSVDFDTVIGKYTYFGDANLDGQVTGDDFALAVSNLGMTGALWIHGDVNFSGAVTGDDLTIIISNLGKGVGNPLGSASVPEPATLTMVGLAAVLLRRRRGQAR